ncbi:MAG: AAA family ATPase [Eubacteriales bacterium]|nr:AAA family ATPase [Eubacteriales bacterium]
MKQEKKRPVAAVSRQDEEAYLARTLEVVRDNVENYGREVARMQEDIDEMLEHYHDNDAEVLTILNNTVTMHAHMKRALERNEKALKKPYFGRIVFHDETLDKEESLYIGRGGIALDTTYWMVVDWRAPVANAYYENGLGRCSYPVPGGGRMPIELRLKRTYEIGNAKLLDYFDTEVIANDELLTRYLAKNKQAVLGEIIATIQKEQNEIIRKSPYHSMIVQGVAGSGKTTVAMHRISYILYNYAERFRPEDFYIVGSNRILLDYITGVLPDLDVYGVRQMTMEQLFVRLLYEEWEEEKYRICPVRKEGPGGCVRGRMSWFEELENFCRELEWRVIPRNSVTLNPRQFVEGIRDGKGGVYDRTGDSRSVPAGLVTLLDREAIERYIRQNPTVSVQSKIRMLNERLMGKVQDEFLGKGVKYTEAEKKAIRRAYRGSFGKNEWKRPIFELYREFLLSQKEKGYEGGLPENCFDVYDLAALAYLYKRVKETEAISEAHHVVIDEAQDFGMMAYAVLKYCIRDCTYTIMGDVSQNIRMGYGLNDWEEAKRLLLSGERDSFCVLRKSYRNTVEISDFAANILAHGSFPGYHAEPVLRHGDPVRTERAADRRALTERAAAICRGWQAKGFDTIAVICRTKRQAADTAEALGKLLPVAESDPEKAVFDRGILVLPVEYTKGLEFDAVLLLDPDREDYPSDDGHAKLLYVAATRALHELCILHTGQLTGLIADPVPEKNRRKRKSPDAPALRGRISIVRNPQTAQSSPDGHPAVPGQSLSGAQGRERPAAGKPAAGRSTAGKPAAVRPVSERLRPASGLERPAPAPIPRALPGFGDRPDTGLLRPAGHGRADQAVRWAERRPGGLYLQSRYGQLRLAPVGSGIVRVTFAKEALPEECHPLIAANRVEKSWQYRDGAKYAELGLPELCLQIEKATGAIRYLDQGRKLLLAENTRECRLVESTLTGSRCRLFLDWQKGEKLYAAGAGGKAGFSPGREARYISHGTAGELPFLISDRGYGLLIASEKPVFFCDIPAYGSQLCLEGQKVLDFYFIAGRRPDTLLNACAYLCGRL